MRDSWLPLALLALIIGIGSFVRLAHLERGDFRDDELFQYYTAESLERGEGPYLPSGREYLRGIDVTHMVRVSIRYLGPTATAIRLPSALLGTLGLLLFAVVLWSMAGPWPAVWGTFLLAVYPEAVGQSRQLRFYTYQMLFGLGALYTGWRALRHAGEGADPDRTAVRRQWLWAAATLGLLVMAARVQVVSLSILAGWGVCVLVAAGADLKARGPGAWRSSVALQLVGIGALALVLVLIAKPGLVGSLIARSQAAPYWALLGERTHPLTYYGALRDEFPVLLAFLPLIFLAAIANRPRLGIYLAVWFAIPLFLHSFVFPWKELRFVMLAMPALFAAAGICAAMGASAVLRGAARATAELRVPVRLRRPAAYAVVAVISITVIGTMPAVFTTRALFRADRGAASRWSQSAEIIRSRPDLTGIPTGTNYALHGLYYWPRLDFVIRVHGLERSTTRTPDGEWVIELNPMGSLEYKTGRPVLTTPEAIREHFAAAGAVLVGYSPPSSGDATPFIEQSLHEILTAEAEELCRGRCGPMNLFYWRFDAPAADVAALRSAPLVNRGAAISSGTHR